ncbi:MAG: tetratricopeptide repeat protein [Gemmataceae bacterium]
MQDPIAPSISPNATTASGPVPPLPAAPPTVEAPPGYEIQDEIGQGGMGTVLRAREQKFDRPVALKILQARLASSEQAVRRFFYEAQVTARLQHPGIPPVHDLGTLTDGRPFLVMKLIPGKTLDRLLKDEGPGASRWLGVFEAICQAVAYAHSQGVIHRDLKPANIMVGAFGEVQVMDWGLAKLLGVAEEEGDPEETTTPTPVGHNATQAGEVLGTPAYMAPEQAAGAVTLLDRRSDVFGLGAILCCLLTGWPPFVGASAEVVRIQAAQGKVEEAFARLDACEAEPELVALAKRCLAADPAQRPGDAGEVAVAIAELRRAAEMRARGAERERAKAEVRAAEQRKRRRLLLVAGGLIGAVLLVGMVGTTIGLVRTRAARDQARARYEIAREAFDQMIFTVQDELQALPGNQRVRRHLLESARAGLRQLVGEAERPGQVDRSLLVTHIRLGRTEEELGNLEAASEEYEAAHRLAETLHQTAPEPPRSRNDVALCLDQRGDLLLKRRRFAEAETLFRQALALRQANDEDPPDEETQRGLIGSYMNLATVAERQGQAEEAMRHAQAGLAAVRQLAKQTTGEMAPRKVLGEALLQVGDALMANGQTGPAQEVLTEALALSERLMADGGPREARFRGLFSRACTKLGALELSRGKIPEAQGYYRRALEMDQRRLRDDPANDEIRRDLGISHLQLGDLARTLGEGREAAEQYRQAADLYRRRAADHPDNAQALADLAHAQGRQGQAAAMSGQIRLAVTVLQEGLATLEQLARLETDNRQVAADQATLHCQLGDLLEEQGQVAEALTQFQKALALRKRDPAQEREQAVCLDRIAGCLRQLGRLPEALTYYRQAVEVQTRRAGEQPNHVRTQGELVLAQLNLGLAAMTAFDYSQAEQVVMQAQATLERMWRRGQVRDPGQALGNRTVRQVEEELSRRLAACRVAQQVLRRLDPILTIQPTEAAALFQLRVRALLAQGQLGEAIKTAECWRDWGDKLTSMRDEQRYQIACAFALCAAADREMRREALVRQCVAQLRQLRERGYFRDEKRRAHFAQDADFAGIRQHPALGEFTRRLAP